MPWVDTDFVDNVVGEANRHRLFSDGDGAYLQSIFDQYESSARAYVKSRLLNSGYEIPDDLSAINADAAQYCKESALVFMLLKAYGRPDINLPWPDTWAEYRQRAEEIVSGDARVPGVTPSVGGAVGGMDFSDTRAGVEGARPLIFGRSNLDVL